MGCCVEHPLQKDLWGHRNSEELEFSLLTHNGSPAVDNMMKRVWVKSRKSLEHRRDMQLFLEFPASGLPCLILNLGGGQKRMKSS